MSIFEICCVSPSWLKGNASSKLSFCLKNSMSSSMISLSRPSSSLISFSYPCAWTTASVVLLSKTVKFSLWLNISKTSSWPCACNAVALVLFSNSAKFLLQLIYMHLDLSYYCFLNETALLLCTGGCHLVGASSAALSCLVIALMSIVFFFFFSVMFVGLRTLQ